MKLTTLGPKARRLSFALALALSWIAVADAGAEVPEDEMPRFACMQLEDALGDLSADGLRLLWSDGLVRSGQQIRPSVAEAAVGVGDRRRSLEILLEPFGLRAEAAAEGDLLRIVDADGRLASTRARVVAPSSSPDDGTLPAWTDRSALPVVWSFPSEHGGELPNSLPQAVRDTSTPHLIVRLRSEAFRAVDGAAVDWQGMAFELKERLVELESSRPGLQVALDGDPALVGRFVSEGLAPYLDAYVHRGSPFVPELDATARTWWWADGAPTALPVLLDASLRGDGLVIFAGQNIESSHRDFLNTIDASGTAEAETPPFLGVAPDRVRFLIHPTRGDLLLALYAEPDGPTELTFALPGIERVEARVPSAARFQTQQTQEGMRLWLDSAQDGGSRHYLFEITMLSETMSYRDVEVSDTELVDAYEQVERNQVFQRRERESFYSLDVMEYIRSTPQWAGGGLTEWTHRILQRKGKLTEFHHLGFSLNGAPYPEEKLLMGRLFRTEALVQLYPLELEFDETYAYRYRGMEEIGGREAYEIEFEPLRKGSREEGSLVRGTLWLDRRTAAHLRVRILQKGLEGSLVQRETTTDYGWIADDDQCFWDWRRRTGVSVFHWGGQTYSTRQEVVREDFDYNRPDIDEVVRAGHESDVMIHVETPPVGHRWLIRTEEGGRRVQEEAEPYPTLGLAAAGRPGTGSEALSDTGLATTSTGGGGGGGGQLEVKEDVDEEEEIWSSRVLADVHAFSRHARLDFGGFGSQRGEDVEIFPGLVLTDSDFLRKGIDLYFGLFKDYAIGTVNKSGLFGRDAVFSARADISFEFNHNPDWEVLGDGSEIYTGLDMRQHEFRFDLALPMARGLSSRIGYGIRTLETESNGVEGFVRPLDTAEHLLLLGLDIRRGAGLATLGLEVGMREDWEAWGVDGAQPLNDQYTVARAAYGTYRRFSETNSVGVDLVLSKGWDLDRFSRMPFARARETVTGFGSRRGFDEGAFAGVTWATSLFRKVPITFFLEGGHQRIEGEEWIDRVGMNVRFLVHGPFKLDIWPIVGYGISSSIDGEAGNVSYGLMLRRRY
ncbi:MAG: hypothetical protein MPN21_07565 [Thermoanaerobaculia bacterium]|nr:hypothetical protein [Thermoanaerobaculia bacterium]